MTARMRGSTLISTLAVVREMNPGPRPEEWIRSCPNETQQLLTRTIIAIEWVPADLIAPFLQVLLQRFCMRDELRFRKLMRAVFKRDFLLTHRTLVNTMTTSLLLPKLPMIWSSVFDGSTARAQLLSTDDNVYRGLIEIRDFVCQSTIFGLLFDALIEQLVVHAGARNYLVTRTRESHRDGVYNCDYMITF